jgi:hypothetical protein
MSAEIKKVVGNVSPEIQKELEKRGWALSALSEAAATLARVESQDLLVQEVCAAIASQGPYVLAWVGKAGDDEKKTVTVIGAYGSALEYVKDIQVSWSEFEPSGLGPGGTAIRTGISSVVFDSESDEGFLSWRERARQFGIRSAVGCPIPDGANHPYGVLLVYSKIPNAFGESEVQLFESLAQEIGFGLRSIERQHKLDDQIHEKELVQERLASSLRATIAKKLGWSDERIQSLYMAGMVHDIGKVAVPAEILTKPTRLTDLEMQMVQGHVESGYQILKDIPFPWPIAEMVHQHHERLDGSGYPKGLKGEEICPEARILAVADTIEAMATHRPYSCWTLKVRFKN